MAHVFISYRRADSEVIAGRIYDRLVQAFGRANVFKDVDRIPPGSDFVTELQNAVRESDVMLVLIGPQWASITDRSGNPRLANPEDFVRMEVEMGLQRPGMIVIPVLVQGAQMPGVDELSSPVLKQLTRRNAVIVRNDPDFHRDMDRLIGHIKRVDITPQPEPRTRPAWWVIGAAGVAVVALIAVLLIIANGGGSPTPAGPTNTPTTPPAVAEAASETPTESVTPTATETTTQTATPPTVTPTFDALEQVFREYTQTAAAWTDTPTATFTSTDTPTVTATPTETPNLDATLNEARTIAAMTLETWTPTFTPTPTATNTPTARERALALAAQRVTTNTGWTPYTEAIGGVEMALVPAGCFQMGNDPYAYDYDTQGVGDGGRQCFDEPFWIGRYEVTNAQYAAFLNARGNQEEGGSTWLDADSDYVRIHQGEGGWTADAGYADHPVVEVSWFGARAYAAWLSETTGLEWSLPTEAQWEYAARGPDALVYPWENEFDGNRLNFCDTNCTYDWRDPDYDDGYERTAPVGTYSPAGDSWVGAADLAGNVWEWVSSLYASYPYDAADGREDAGDTTTRRVVRGGSYLLILSRARAASRYYNFYLRIRDFGFRVCCASPI